MPKWLQALINFFKPAQKPSVPVVDKPVETKPPVTQQPTQSNDKLKNPPWYTWMLKNVLGKNEHDKAFDKFMSQFWTIVGLKGYKTIAGSNYAWCGLAVAAALYSTGYQYAKNGAGAKNWDAFGTKIAFVEKGIPHGAFVRLNHGFNCSTSKGNHVGFACGNYKPSDFFDSKGKLKSGATITLLGGNQADQGKYSKYDMREVCSVGWVKEELPPEVTKTIPCDTSAKSGESTQ